MENRLRLLAVLIIIALALGALVFSPKDKPLDSSEVVEVTEEAPQVITQTYQWMQTVLVDDTIITPKDENSFTLVIDSQGNLSGSTDCNSFSGAYIIDETGAITIKDVATTLMVCEDSQEQLFLGQLQSASRVGIDDENNLALFLPEDSGVMVFTHQE